MMALPPALIEVGDIYHLDPTKGHEQRGKRYVLFVSSDGYNKITQMPIVAPITDGGEFARIAGFTVSIPAVPSPPAASSGWISFAPSTSKSAAAKKSN